MTPALPPSCWAGDAERVNVVSLLRGRGDAPPLLLYGHLDVVPTAAQPWEVSAL